MDNSHRPLRRVTSTQQPAVPVGKLPYAGDPADDSQGVAPWEPEAATTSTQVEAPHGSQQSEQSKEAGSAEPHRQGAIEDEHANHTVVTPNIGGDDLTTTANGEPTNQRPKPTPETSGDKKIKRDTTPRRDLVTFEDDPQHKPLSNRRKKTRLNKGGMFFNERDRAAILLVAAHGWLDKEQLAQLIGGVSADSLRHSLKRLVTHGLLDDKFIGFQNEVLYTATAFGLRKVGAVGFHTQVTPKMQTIEHTEAITATHIHLKAASGNNPNVCFVTERELQAAATSGVLTPRILTQFPWTAAYTDFAKWVPSTVTAKGKPVYKRPDGLVLQFRDGKAQPPVPVEIERSIKTRTDYYQQAALMFANTAASGHISPNVFYFAPSSTGVQEALTKALAAVYDPNSGFNWPAALPRIGFDVQDLDSFYLPYSATRGWIAASSIDQTDAD